MDSRPVPVDDGAADGFVGSMIPAISLVSTEGGLYDLEAAAAGRLVVYVYPRTGRPGEPLPDGWDEIPGALGCTPQSCAFRDHLHEFAKLRAAVVGVSAQSSAEQAEFAEREHIPYPLLSDSEMQLHSRLTLPTFQADGILLYKRLTFIACRGKIEKVFYPVFPPEQNAAEVLAWLAANRLS